MSIINCAQTAPDIIQFSGEIPVTAWTNSNNIYSYTIKLNGCDEDMFVITLVFTNNSQQYQAAPIQWETQTDKVIFTTTIIPTGTLSYDMVVAG